jgi:hypothetical protein
MQPGEHNRPNGTPTGTSGENAAIFELAAPIRLPVTC